MRVAFVTGNLNLGGTTTFLLNLCGALESRGCASTVISLEPQHPMSADFQAARIDVKLIDEKPRIFEDVVRWGWERCRDFAATHVVANLGYSSFEVARHAPLQACRLAMIQSDDSRVYRGLDPYSCYLSGIVGVSRHICEVASSFRGLGSLPVSYQPYGIPVPSLETLAQRKPTGRGRPIKILFLGRLYREQKRVHLFPEIWRGLESFIGPLEWTIAGDGEEREWLVANLPSTTSRKITFAGHVDYALVPGLLLEHDILLLPSDYEGLPLSLLEAMAHGVVPVVSKLPSGVGDVVAPEFGRLIEIADTASYARAIVELAENPSELARLSGLASVHVRESYSTKAMADRWMTLLQSQDRPVEWPKNRSIETYLPQQGRFAMHRMFRPFRRLKRKLF